MEKIGEHRKIVEIDESKIEKRNFNRGAWLVVVLIKFNLTSIVSRLLYQSIISMILEVLSPGLYLDKFVIH